VKSHFRVVAPSRPRHIAGRHQKGFTLIELIVVLVILGILAAFAIPRFANVSADARVAAMQGLAGSLRSSSALVHGLALARSVTTGTVPLEGSTVSVVNGYPSAADDGIVATVLNLEGFEWAHASGVTTFRPRGFATTTSCTVVYTAATGTVTQAGVTTGNCG
jgi:MSHA pilin protein MshA